MENSRQRSVSDLRSYLEKHKDDEEKMMLFGKELNKKDVELINQILSFENEDTASFGESMRNKLCFMERT